MGATDQLLLQVIGEDDGATAVVNQTATSIEGLTASEQQAVKASSDVTQQNASAGLSFTDLNNAISLAKQGVDTFKQVWDFTEQGAQIQRINDQWTRTASTMGVNADQIISQVQKVTNNTVDDEEIMKNATREIAQGVATSGQQVVDFFHIARAQTVLYGGDVVSNAQAIDLAIETGASKQLKARGILVDFTRAENDYAKSIGTTKDKLTEEQIIEVRRNEVLRAGNDLVAKAGDTAKDTATKFEQLTVKIQDMTDAVKQQAAAGASYLFDVVTPTDDKIQQFKNTIILETLAFGENSYQVKASEDALTNYLRVQKEVDIRMSDGINLIQSGYIPATSQAVIATNSLTDSQAALDRQQAQVKQSNAEYTQSIRDISKAFQDEAIAHGDMAEKLNNAKPADIAKEALAGLKTELQNGAISQGQYTGLVQATQEKFGLATAASYAMQTGIGLLNSKFADGVISAQQYQDGLAALPKAAADGVVTLSDLGIKLVDTHQSKLDKLNELGNTAELTSQQTATKNIQDSAAAANGAIDDIITHWKRVPAVVKTNYQVTITTTDLGNGGNYASGGIVGAANGIVLTGEFGPERVSLPVGSQVHQTSQYNQYNNYDITTNDMGMAYLLESQRMAMQGQLERRMS